MSYEHIEASCMLMSHHEQLSYQA